MTTNRAIALDFLSLVYKCYAADISRRDYACSQVESKVLHAIYDHCNFKWSCFVMFRVLLIHWLCILNILKRLSNASRKMCNIYTIIYLMIIIIIKLINFNIFVVCMLKYKMGVCARACTNYIKINYDLYVLMMIYMMIVLLSKNSNLNLNYFM